MKSKKILIISSSFYPVNSPRSFRTTELAKEFSRQGHDVTVITPKNFAEHPNFQNKFNIRIMDMGQPKLNKVKLGVGKIDYYINRVLNLLTEYPDIGYMFLVSKTLKKLNENFDLLISVAVPHPIHWGVARVWDKHKIANTWVADCGDPYMKTTIDNFRHPFYLKYFEKSFCKKADFITVPIKEAIDAYYPEFHNKIRVIPQGFKFDEIEIDSGKRENGMLTFIYAGNIIPNKRDPRKFLDFILSTDYVFRFILYTTKRKLIEPYASRSNGKIEIREQIPRHQMIKELASADFLLNINNNVKTQAPSKLIDYHISGRPILSIDSTTFNEKVVLEFLNRDYTNQLVIDNPDQYRIENVVNNFLKLI